MADLESLRSLLEGLRVKYNFRGACSSGLRFVRLVTIFRCVPSSAQTHQVLRRLKESLISLVYACYYDFARYRMTVGKGARQQDLRKRRHKNGEPVET